MKNKFINNILFVLILMQLTIACNQENSINPETDIKIKTLQLSEINQFCFQTKGCFTDLSCGGEVVCSASIKIIEQGVCYGYTNPPTVNDSKIIDSTNKGKFISKISELISDSIYFFRAYVITGTGTYYGDVVAYVSKVIDYDGNTYKTVTIGKQIWMGENLKVTHYRNGDPISFVKDNGVWNKQSSGAYCNYNNDEKNSLVYGKLYNYYTITDKRDICPAGWHIPSESEWNTLITYLGNDTTAGGKLKEQGIEHWFSPNLDATNDYDFSSLPAGYRTDKAEFAGLGMTASWWTSTFADNKIAWSFGISFNKPNIFVRGSEMNMGLSVRCVKDL